LAARPSISVVTPALNQARWVEATLRSVLDCSTPPAEYVVLDGGSTDGTADTIARFGERLTAWASRPDGGQYEAIMHAFDQTTGEVMAWLNAGDVFLPWALQLAGDLFARFPQIEWLTTQRPVVLDEDGVAVQSEYVGGFARDSFRAGVNLPGGDWFARAGIQQESTFWRRSLWERAGSRVATELRYAGDFELWLRFFEHAEPYAVDVPLGAHRVHEQQKTETLEPYVAEARDALAAAGGTSGGRSAARRLVYHTLGRRPLRRLPTPLALPLRAAGLLHRARTVVWRDGEWNLVDDYVV
jgi:glycosyltransferase involved in cell wall biosynthesis